MAKLTLDNESIAQEFFEDCVLIGIVAPIKDYQLCWNLNQLLNFDFRVNHDIEIQKRNKNRNYYFSIFQYQIPTTSITHYLYNNQFDGEFLLPEFKHLDFLWLIKGDGEIIEKEEANVLIQSMRALPGVQLVTEMTHEKIKNKQYLIF